MKTLNKTYKVYFARTLLICLIDVIVFFFLLLFSCIMFYGALTIENMAWGGRITFVLVALFFSLYVGLYPLLIYWSYYQHDKHITLTIDGENSEIIYTNKTVKKIIRMKEIVRLEQYYSSKRMLKMQYYKIILKEDSPITITCLLNTRMWKEFDTVPFKRIKEDNLWLLKRED